ncbi:MAG: hypothetical protein HYW48_08575 [Deltaproteobacteria bacterium]|nr:hypothetical protein [Deltaproteobacteria bacterium]
MRIILLIGSIAFSGCVSLTKEERKAPKVTETMPLPEAIAVGIEFGGRTLDDVKKLIKKTKQWDKAEELTFRLIKNHKSDWPTVSLVNAMNLYQLSPSRRSFVVFKDLVRSDRIIERQLAWQLAASQPSEKMAIEIDEILTDAVLQNELSEHLLPRMADAVANNGLKDSYTIVREGLFTNGDSAFAKAMLTLAPQKASEDFMGYLAKAPIEELRQMNVQSVDVFTCTLILQHFLANPPPMSDPRLEVLFLYSISRNNGLAEMARDVLEALMPRHGEHLAYVLAQLPTWMQLAFIEKANMRLTPVVSLFLDELKRASPHPDVSDEIQSVKSR